MTDCLINQLIDLFTQKVSNPCAENIISDEFYRKLIYNGPPQTTNETPMFKLLAANMGLEFAINWALDRCGVLLFNYIANPSRKVLCTAISLDPQYYDKYKSRLTEDDLILIVKMKGSGLFGPPGWRLLYKLDPQPLSVIKAALDVDSKAISAIKDQTPELCEYCVLQKHFSCMDLEYVKHRTTKINQKILENVRSRNCPLRLLNKSLITRDLLEPFLVQDYDDSLKDVVGYRDDLIDASLIEMATSNPNTRNFKYIPNNLKSIEMCRKFVKISLDNLLWVPSCYKLNEVTDESVLTDRAYYQKYQNESVTTALAKMLIAFKTSTRRQRLDFINDCSEDEIMLVLQYNPRAYCKLRDNRKSDRVTIHAIRLNGWNLEYVPANQYNEELLNIAISSEPGAVKYKRTN